MPISIQDFFNRVSTPNADLFLLVCAEAVIFDCNSQIVYIPESTYNNANMNPMADFRTHLGHLLLWSRHINIKCTSLELWNFIQNAGYELAPYETTEEYCIYSLNNLCKSA